LKTIAITSKGYKNFPPEDFLNKWTFVNLSPGLGKTYKIVYLIVDYCLGKWRKKKTKNPHLKLVICMPNHNKIYEFTGNHGERMVANFVHLLGKDQYDRHSGVPVCLVEDEMMRINPGCGVPWWINNKKHFPCEFSEDCLYHKQWRWGRDVNVIFCVKEHLQIACEMYNPDVVIIDETVESLIAQGIKIPKRIWKKKWITYNILDCETNCPIKEVCKLKDKFKRYVKSLDEEKLEPKERERRIRGFKFRRCALVLHHKINKERLTSFEPQTLEEYHFKEIFQRESNLYGIMDSQKGFLVMAYRSIDFLHAVPTVIFNCATTQLEMAKKVFNHDFEQVFVDGTQLKNKIYMINEKMTINKTEKIIHHLPTYCKFFKIKDNKDFLLYTKKKFKDGILVDLFPNISIGNYGDARGYNKYEHCKNVMLLGRFDLRESVKLLLWFRGYEHPKETNWLGKAEEIQALHRIRPLLNENKKIFLFTNSLSEYLGDKITLCFTLADLEITREIKRKRKNLIGLSKSGVREVIGHHNSKIAQAFKILHEFGYCNDMNKYGAKLEWLT